MDSQALAEAIADRFDTRVMTPHPLGEDDHRGETVRHMCPECGYPPSFFCATCLGVGTVSEDRLYRWQNEHLARRP